MLLRASDSMTGPQDYGRTSSTTPRRSARFARTRSPDNGRIMNLLRDLRTKVEDEVDTQPALRGIIERAERVREADQGKGVCYRILFRDAF
jgi:hypothetical protein